MQIIFNFAYNKIMFNKLQNRNSRICFINFLTSQYFSDDVIDDLETILFECDFNEEFFQQLMESYEKNKDVISKFISTGVKMQYSLEYNIMFAACVEIMAFHTPIQLIVTEYLQISDHFTAMSSIIHSKIDKFYQFIQAQNV
jgi:transcription termination factor NusB